VGTSYTKNLLNREELVDNALNSLQGKVKGDFSFPENHNPEDLLTFDSSIKDLSNEKVLDELKRICSYVKDNSDGKGQFDVSSSYGTGNVSIMNTNDLNVNSKNSYFYTVPRLSFPNTYACVMDYIKGTGFKPFSNSVLGDIISLFNKSLPEVKADNAEMDVIFSPMSMYALTWRIMAGTSAKSIYEDISPLKKKIGIKIFSDKISVLDNTIEKGMPDSRSFDDEGIATSQFSLVSKGVLRGFFTNLDYAEKLKMKPTGHGYKEAMWGGETITLKPTPSLTNLTMLPGETSLQDMIKKIKRGVLLLGCLGAHSGNIPNGDFSIGLNPGLYIKDGEIVGRVKDGMAAGNIYEIFKNVADIEDKLHDGHGGRFPHIWFEGVKVSS